MNRHKSRSLWNGGGSMSASQRLSIAEEPKQDSPARTTGTMKRWDSFGSWDSNMSLHDSVLECVLIRNTMVCRCRVVHCVVACCL